MARGKQGEEAQRFEKLGAFYLGRVYDRDGDEIRPDPLLYDSKDLTTHAVCVGMTGSGKTGLCVSLLEEAAIDGIPALAIDPKGDLGNLMLTFPRLRPEDFEPWVDEGEATRKGMTPDQYAASVAEMWQRGLSEWGQSGRRIERLRQAAEVAIYTPGSSAGLPLTLLRSFAAPAAALADDADAFRERIASAVSGLLALVGLDADPIRSREHILLSNIFDAAWREGRDLDLPTLIAQVQSPPFEKLGVMDVETFFPRKERFDVAMRLNNLLGSPRFASWSEGEPLDIARLLWTVEGRPRIAVLSIAHLPEPERMFFVTIVLNELIAWMRSQPGTTSLRALLYMDEVFGYFPPTANPPSKTPMLTLLKQARAYGVGVVLATQNPVDLDYKGLSNAGTWFLGRLQTERDKLRVLEGLEGASATTASEMDRSQMEQTLAGLSSRVFLMHNVHEDGAVLFHTRWAMSYLRGPLTRDQIQILMADRKAAAAAAPRPARRALTGAGKRAPQASATRPALPSGVQESFLASVTDRSAETPLVYRPALLGTADLHFANARQEIDTWKTVSFLVPLGKKATGNVWAKADPVDADALALLDEPEDPAQFLSLPARATRAATYSTWKTAFKSHVYRHCPLTLWRCKQVKLTSTLGEAEADFRIRVRAAAREKRDLAVEKLRKRYTPKLARLQARIRTAEQRVRKEEAQYGQQKMQTAISMGATVLGALFGRKVASVGTVGRAATTVRGVGRAARERQDIAIAQEKLGALEGQIADLEGEFEGELAALQDGSDPDGVEISEVAIRPRKADITIGVFGVTWMPWVTSDDGLAQPAFEEDL